ncbi:MAG: class I tRNA ligase family protein, partial [Verrucomicrobiales bacterium]
FMGPLEQVKPWSTKGVEGVYRFLSRAWRLFMESDADGNWSLSEKIADIEPTNKQRKVLHETIKKVTHDTETLAFNTAISKMMECVNEFTQAEERSATALATFLQLLNPYAPHLSEELNAQLGGKFDCVADEALVHQAWPVHDESFLVEDEIEMVVQVNGKLRDKITVANAATKESIEAQALAAEKVQSFLEGNTVRRVIVVPGKLVNIVAN